MRYKEAGDILQAIKEAKSVLLSLHVSPDPDSVGSNLALYYLLKTFGKKKIEIISPDNIPVSLSFLPGFDSVKQEDILKKNLTGFDLLISLDCQGSHRLNSLNKPMKFPKNLKVVVVDHHYTNLRYGAINLVDSDISSTSEILYNLACEWKVKVDKNVATCLLTGIAGDTAVFRYPSATPNTLRIAATLIECGASLSDISANFYRRIRPKTLKFWGAVLQKIKIERIDGISFGWSAMSFSDIQKIGGPDANTDTSDLFFGSIEGTDFGLLLTEEKKGEIRGSLRARTDVNVAEVAKTLGGAGHKAAAGFRYKTNGQSFTKDIEAILSKVKEICEKT